MYKSVGRAFIAHDLDLSISNNDVEMSDPLPKEVEIDIAYGDLDPDLPTLREIFDLTL